MSSSQLTRNNRNVRNVYTIITLFTSVVVVANIILKLLQQHIQQRKNKLQTKIIKSAINLWGERVCAVISLLSTITAIKKIILIMNRDGKIFKNK